MSKWLIGRISLAAALSLAACIPAAAGKMAPPPPVANRVATADCIVVGKVTSVEEKPVAASPYPGADNKVPYKIAVVQIKNALVGAKGLTAVRVGFIPPMNEGGRRRGYPPVNLTAGQEGCFFLTRHHQDSFFTVPTYVHFVAKNNNFDKELTQVKHFVKLLDDPKAGLTSKKVDDRLLTAALLLARYRTYRPTASGEAKLQPIDAGQSKLILNALAEADWTKARPYGDPSPLNLFQQLGMTEKDGWKQPQIVKDYVPEMAAAAKEWLKKNGASYRIQRFVADKPEKK